MYYSDLRLSTYTHKDSYIVWQAAKLTQRFALSPLWYATFQQEETQMVIFMICFQSDSFHSLQETRLPKWGKPRVSGANYNLVFKYFFSFLFRFPVH